MSDWSILQYDSSDDEKKLYEKSLEIADNKSKSIWDRISFWLVIQDCFEKDQPSIQNLKRDLKNVLSK